MQYPAWPKAPDHLTPEIGYAHIFWLSLDLPEERLGLLSSNLSVDEKARSARFLRPDDGAQFTAGRGQLREILSRYLHQPPGSLEFRYSQRGKPELTQLPDHLAGLRFNFSNTRSAGLLAITFGPQVGVDLESLERRVDFANIVRRYFAPAEVEELFSLPPEEQSLAFITGWTRKEAYIKAHGAGLAIPLDSFQVSLSSREPPRLLCPEPGWQLYALDAGPAYAAALVTSQALDGLRCYRWE